MLLYNRCRDQTFDSPHECELAQFCRGRGGARTLLEKECSSNRHEKCLRVLSDSILKLYVIGVKTHFKIPEFEFFSAVSERPVSFGEKRALKLPACDDPATVASQLNNIFLSYLLQPTCLSDVATPSLSSYLFISLLILRSFLLDLWNTTKDGGYFDQAGGTATCWVSYHPFDLRHQLLPPTTTDARI